MNNKDFSSLSPLSSPTAAEPKEPFPKLTFYNHRLSPFGQRVLITLRELKLPHEEVLVDLSKPREEWFLKLNPRGQVPVLKISREGAKDIVLVESGIICQFLADAFPSPTFCPPSTSQIGPLFRARAALVADAWSTRVRPASSNLPEDAEAAAKARISVLKAEIEPHLEDCNPFFGGSKTITLADALLAPFVIRLDFNVMEGVIDANFREGVKQELPGYAKWEEAISGSESVKMSWDEKAWLEYKKRVIEGK